MRNTTPLTRPLMRRQRRLNLLLVMLSVLTLTTAFVLGQTTAKPKAKPAGQPGETLTNDSIVSLVREGFKEKTILSLIRTSRPTFDLSAPRLIQLKRSGVNETVIQAMIDRQAVYNRFAEVGEGDYFTADDEAFFNSPPKVGMPEMKRRGSESAGTETRDIFGSQTGSQSRSRSRGGLNGDLSGSSQVAGSATVKILKPPIEGGGDPKLERAARLTNQAIIDMIQAGFSEGTILRKIEITQVEFDVSSAALDNLRRNRVSERIVKAMRSAMDESK